MDKYGIFQSIIESDSDDARDAMDIALSGDRDDPPEQFAAANKGHGKGFSPDDMLGESGIAFI